MSLSLAIRVIFIKLDILADFGSLRLKLFKEVIMKVKKFGNKLLFLILIFGFTFLINTQVNTKSGSGIYMSVCGKVINIKTGSGIPGVEVEISNIDDNVDDEGDPYSGTSDNDGNFCIKYVPAGIYEICEYTLYSTCPQEFIIESMRTEIKVPTGRNIIKLNIYLTEGGSIKGRIFSEDGITPMNKASVSISDWRLEGKNQGVITNINGEFNLQGLMEGSIYVLARVNGYATELRTAQVTLGEVLENVDFILGRGEVTLKGRILSTLNHQSIKGAVIGIFSDSKGNRGSSGMDFSNENGFYNMKGLREPGIFTVESGHKDYKILKTKVDLKLGENIIDFHLEPKEELMHEIRYKEYSAKGASGTSYSRKCKTNNRKILFDRVSIIIISF